LKNQRGGSGCEHQQRQQPNRSGCDWPHPQFALGQGTLPVRALTPAFGFAAGQNFFPLAPLCEKRQGLYIAPVFRRCYRNVFRRSTRRRTQYQRLNEAFFMVHERNLVVIRASLL
jgi:hypothetical protein